MRQRVRAIEEAPSMLNEISLRRLDTEGILQRTRPVDAQSAPSDASEITVVMSSSPTPPPARMSMPTTGETAEWRTRLEGEPAGRELSQDGNAERRHMQPTVEDEVMEDASVRMNSPGERARREASDEFARRRWQAGRPERQTSPMSWMANNWSSSPLQPPPYEYHHYQQNRNQHFNNQQSSHIDSGQQHQTHRNTSTQRFTPGAQMSNNGLDNEQQPLTQERQLTAVLAANAELTDLVQTLVGRVRSLEAANMFPEGMPAHHQERAEYVKPEMVGYLNPVPPHLEWNGQPTDDKGVYIAFNAWISHVEAVLRQKDTAAWRRAVLDTATLQCLRGPALSWWTSLSAEQQEALRVDYTLGQWRALGAKLTRRNYVGRKEAFARKRRPGETLVEYAYAKHAMLKDAYGERSQAELVADIRDGMSVHDQLLVRTEYARRPTVQALIDELARIDEIRAEEFKTATRTRITTFQQGQTIQASQSFTNRQGNKTAGATIGVNPYVPKPRAPRTPFQYDPKMIKMRPNPAKGNTSALSYEFPDGRTIFMNRECRHCSSMAHFDFQCLKKPGAARAAPMFVEDEEDRQEDSVDFFMATYETSQEVFQEEQAEWEEAEGAWDESANVYASGN